MILTNYSQKLCIIFYSISSFSFVNSKVLPLLVLKSDLMLSDSFKITSKSLSTSPNDSNFQNDVKFNVYFSYFKTQTKIIK
uniref:CSON015580 protein n=1 Tax=Culicoides sonorensis TaxID=179676 RepID=A0A336KUU0_CULSO